MARIKPPSSLRLPFATAFALPAMPHARAADRPADAAFDAMPTAAPSPWVQGWAHLIAAGAAVLDVACGSGRHMRWLAGRGHAVTGVDRDAAALRNASQWGRVLAADIESGPWPLAGQVFGGVVVTHYLWRPLLPAIAAAVAPGGVLIYETFAQGNEALSHPSRPDFLLRPGELLQVCAPPAWHVVAYEHGFLDAPARLVQRIAAVRMPHAADDAAGSAAKPPRHALRPPAPDA